MSEMRESVPPSVRPMRAVREEPEPTGWVGWVMFAGVMLLIGGFLNGIYGLVALLNSHWVAWEHTSNVYLSVHGWGWIALIGGIVAVLAGLGVFTGNIVARTVGVIVAGLSLLANFFLVPLFPLWSLAIMVVDALVIWALVAHGREVRNL